MEQIVYYFLEGSEENCQDEVNQNKENAGIMKTVFYTLQLSQT